MILQTGGAVPRSAVELVLTASTETKVVLIVTALFSLISWFIIILKWWQFRRLNKQADRFFAEMERTTRLQEAYHAVMKQPPGSGLCGLQRDPLITLPFTITGPAVWATWSL